MVLSKKGIRTFIPPTVLQVDYISNSSK